MKIAVLSRIFSGVGGGAERYSVSLVEQLAARHEFHVFAQEVNHQWPGVTYHRVSSPVLKPRWVNQLWFAAVTWWATRHGYNVVHSHENTWHGNVQTVHVLPVKHNLFHERKGWRLFVRWIKVGTSPRLMTYLGLERARYAARAGRHIVVTSESLQRIMQSSYPASRGMLSVITPGVNLPAQPITSERRRSARKQLGLPVHKYCLLFVGNDFKKKGLKSLLAALAQLPADVVLAVVGNSAQIAVFESQITALDLKNRVHFLGSLHDMAPAYEAADVLVHPTLEDTFAMVVLEAMAYGLPVVVSAPRYCGISGLLTHDLNAQMLDDPHDVPALVRTLHKLNESQALQQTLSAGALKFAARYTWDALAQQQDAVYSAVLACRKV